MSDNHIASDSSLEWLWITTAIELIARYMPREGAREAAWEFLLIELHAKRIRYRYQGQAKYEGWFFPLDYFWLRGDKSITHEITAGAAVIRRGIALVRAEPPPPMEHRPGFERLNPGARDNEERYVFDPHGRTTVVRLELVQLHQGDILRRLQERGLLPTQQELPLHKPAEQSSPLAHSPDRQEGVPQETANDEDRAARTDAAKNRGGHPVEFDINELLTEALVYAGVAGRLPKTATGEGGLHDQLKLRLGDRCPERTRFGEIFGPIFQRIKDENKNKRSR